MVQNFEKGSKSKKGYKVLGFGVLRFKITWVSQLNFIFYFRILSDVLSKMVGLHLMFFIKMMEQVGLTL